MRNKNAAYAIIVLGVFALAVVFLAAPLGFAGAGFGMKKIIGTAFGVILILGGAGLFLTVRTKNR